MNFKKLFLEKKYDTKHYQKKSKNIGIYIDKIIHPIVKKKGFIDSKIIINWAQIVGTRFATYTSPKKINYQEDSGILFIICKNSAVGTEIAHNNSDIIDNITLLYGYKYIAHIKIVYR